MKIDHKVLLMAATAVLLFILIAVTLIVQPTVAVYLAAILLALATVIRAISGKRSRR